MVLTVTMNTSVDITYVFDQFEWNSTNRVSNVVKTAGGKGLNVTRVLRQTGTPVLATGMVGGANGTLIKKQLASCGIEYDFYETDRESRNNISIVCPGAFTEILEKGEEVSQRDAEQFLVYFDKLLDSADLVTMSGSLPGGLPAEYYSVMAGLANRKGIKTLLDTSGEGLRAAVRGKDKPYLIKPNEKEIGEILGQPLPVDNLEEAGRFLLEPVFEGIFCVVVSLGEKGAMAKVGRSVYTLHVPKIQAVNPIGSGDSVIAGIAASLEKGEPLEKALRMGMTFGVLNALEQAPGTLKMDRFDDVFSKITVEKII